MKKPKQTWVAVDMFTGEVVTDSSVSRVVLKHRELVNTLATICRMLPPMGEDGNRDWSRMTKAERGMLNRCAKQVHEAGATQEDVDGFTAWWYQEDWRGAEKRQPPGPWDVVKNWSRYLNWREGTDADPLREKLAKSWSAYSAIETVSTDAELPD